MTMGTPCAVVISCIFMMMLELKLFKTLKSLTHDVDVVASQSSACSLSGKRDILGWPTLFARFIDDIFATFLSPQNAAFFIFWYNKMEPGVIIITMDILICGNNYNFLETDIHVRRRLFY